MALIKFSSAILLLLCVSSIYSSQIDSDVIVRVREEDDLTAELYEPAGEFLFEHTQSIQLSSSLTERSITCPKVRDGAYKPEGISSCRVADYAKRCKREDKRECVSGYRFDLTKMFTGASAIDTFTLKARECNGVERKHCKEVPLRRNRDFAMDGDELIVTYEVCQNSDYNNCIRYYKLTVSNSQSDELTKAEGACAPASTLLMIASDDSALTGLDGRCLSSYKCEFEPLNLQCTFARCTFNPQNFPFYLRASNIEPRLDKRGGGIDIDELVYDECYKIRVPSNQKSAALDINNPATCGVHDSEQYGVYLTASICGEQKYYFEESRILNPGPAESGDYCWSDSHCEVGTYCDTTSRPFQCSRLQAE